MIVDIALMKIAASNIHHVVRSTGLLVYLVDRPHASRVRSTGLTGRLVYQRSTVYRVYRGLPGRQ